MYSPDSINAVNTVLNDFFERSIKQAQEIDPSYAQLWQSLRDLNRSGGKRLRPQMVILAYEAFGGQNEQGIVPVAAAQELLHFGLLIHDDIVDRDYIRYGVPNVTGRYKQQYEKYLTGSDLTHFANGAALLGGDLILTSTYQLIASSELTPDEKSTAYTLLAESMFHVTGGQLLDTEASFVSYQPGTALRIALHKTAMYSFVGPLLTGAKLAGINAEQETALRTYAESLGIAYQLVDDLLGVFGNVEETGKSNLGDIREGKQTYTVEQALGSMNQDEHARFDAGFGKPDASMQQIEEVRDLLVSTGARARTEAKTAEYGTQALDALTQLQLDPEHTQKFEALVSRVTDRTF